MAPHPDRNFWLLVGDAGFFALAIVCFDPSVVLPVFVAQFTASPILIGAAAAIKLAGLYLPQLPVAIGIRHLRSTKPFFFWQAAVGRAALLGCVLAAAWAASVPPAAVVLLVLVAWAVFSFTEGAATLAWLDLVGDVVDSRLRGRYFGIIQFLGGVLSIGGGFAVRQALAGDQAPATFAWLFGAGCIPFALSVACIGGIQQRSTPRPSLEPANAEPPLDQVLSLLRGGHLLRLGVAQILASSLQLALPFYVLFARDRLGLSGDWIGSFIVAQTVGMAIAALLWARVAEWYGARLVVCLSGAVLIVIPLLPVLAERVAAAEGVLLLGVFVLAGAARGGQQAGFWQYLLDLVPARDRRVFMGLANTANAPSLLMPLIGGALLAWGGYPWLFAGSIVLGIGATLAGLALATPHPQPTPAD